MTHHFTTDQLNSYLHQTLTDAEREALGRHLMDCPACRTRLDSYEALQRRIHSELAADLHHIQPSSRLSYPAIASRVRRSRRLTRAIKQWHQLGYAALATALLVAMGIGLYLVMSHLSRPAPISPEEIKPTLAVPTVFNQLEITPTVEVSQPLISPTAEVSHPMEFVWKTTGNPNRLSHPTGLGIDSAGNIYVVDTGNERLQKFDGEGQSLLVWGTSGTGEGQFTFKGADPIAFQGDVAVDGQGQVYVTDGGNARIQKFDSQGQFLAAWGSEGKNENFYFRPVSLAVDKYNNIYVLDGQNARVQKFDRNGKFLAQWSATYPDGQLGLPVGIAVDGVGNIYLVDYLSRIQKFDSQGQYLSQWGSYGLGDGQFSQPTGIAIDEQGYIYVVDGDANSRIQKFDSNGQFVFSWAGQGQGDGQFKNPFDLIVDRQGNIYVSDYSKGVIQKFRQPE